MKINLFKNISKNINQIFTKKTEEEVYFYQKFNNFFVLEDFLFCMKMIEEGYVPTKNQKEQINEEILFKLQQNEYDYNDIRFFKFLDEKVKIEGLIKAVPLLNYSYKSCYKNSTNYSFITTLINRKHKLDQEEFIISELSGNKKMVLDATKESVIVCKKMYKKGLDSFKDYCNYDAKEHEYEIEKLEKLIHLNVFVIRAGLYNSEEIGELKEHFENFNKYIERKTSIEFIAGSFSRIKKGMIDDFARALKNYNMNADIESKENLLKQIKSYHSRNKSLSEEIKDLINQEDYSLEKLPLEAKNKINHIKKLIEEINTNEVTHFFNEKLPVILKKYFSIDEEYRTSLKNVEGYNAQELMLQALDNIEKIVIAKKENNNEKLISELSIENRKLKNQK